MLPYAEISRLAAAQRGLITRNQLLTSMSRGQLERASSAGLLRRLQPRVSALPGAQPDWETSLLAVVLSHPSLVVSHRSAARLHGFLPHRSDRLEVSSDSRLVRRGATLHQSSVLPSEVQLIDGFPVTDAGRTLLDLASVADLSVLERACDQALINRCCTAEDIIHSLRRFPAGRRGMAVLRSLAEARMGIREKVESRFEQRVLAALLDHGLPEPVAQYEIQVAAGRFRLDFAYPENRVALEVDGPHHLSRHQFDRDRSRDVALQVEGWRVARCTEATDLRRFAADVKRLLAASR